MAYSAVCPVVFGVSVTATTVIDVAVGMPVGVSLTAGIDTVAPSPIATALAVTVPDTVTAAVAPLTFSCATVEGIVIVLALALYVVGAPVIGTVTVVMPVSVAVPAVNPSGNPLTAKFAGVIVAAYVPFESLYTMLALTACPALRLPSPIEVTVMVGAIVVLITALRTAVPAL